MAVGAIVAQLAGTAAGSNNNKTVYGLKGRTLRSSGSQISGVIPYNNLPTSGKTSLSDKGYAVAKSIIDPSGIFMTGKPSDDEEGIVLPTWEESPYYQSSLESLSNLSNLLMSGDMGGISEFYKSLGMANSPEYQAMIANVGKDTTRAVNENLVRRNVTRGGIGGSSIAQAMADVGAKYGYSDYLQAKSEKNALLNLGANTLGNVNSSALNWTGLKNNFNLNLARTAMGLDAQNFAQAQTNSQSNAQGVSSALGAVGSIAGLFANNNSGGGGGNNSTVNLGTNESLATSAAKSYAGDSYASWANAYANQYLNANRGAA